MMNVSKFLSIGKIPKTYQSFSLIFYGIFYHIACFCESCDDFCVKKFAIDGIMKVTPAKRKELYR